MVTVTERTATALRNLRTALPPREYAAVSAWLTTFYPFQREWLLDFGRFSLILKSRQIGCSHTIAAAAVLWALFGETTTVISLGQREADEVLAKAKLHARALVALGSEWAKAKTESATKLEVESNGRILSLPNSSAGRSFSGNVILDEIGYYERPEEVWDGAAGTALHGYRIRALSTPNGVGNFWHGLWTDERQHAGYTLHCVTLDDAIADGMRVSLDDCWKLARGDERVFAQLFRCTFLDGELQYIPTAAIEACRVESAYQYEGECFAGLDVGRTSDRTELVIVRRDRFGTRWVQHCESRKRTSAHDLELLCATAFAHPYRCSKLCIDATGIGSFPAEQMQERFGHHRVEPVSFTLQSKEGLATSLYEGFCGGSFVLDAEGKPTRGTVRIPRSDETLFAELCSIKRVVTDKGNVTYEAPQTAEGHADRAWALALALHASNGPDLRKHEVYDYRQTA